MTSFRLWAPNAAHAQLQILHPTERIIDLCPEPDGYFQGNVEGVSPGARYKFVLNGETERPDPASRFQPEGVHSASEVIDPHFDWHDAHWNGIPLGQYIIYELHVGTFTQEGTFDAIIPHLADLADLGVTALELMPIAQFPGQRNWGYDGAYPFAAQNSYGGPGGLKRLVDACHQHRLAVILDVVYNHLGPEGNYLCDFGPYFTRCYETCWGDALNFDGAHSDQVRRFFIENALYWQTDFHIDALRLDAVHAIRDFSATPFLQELSRATAATAAATRRQFYLIAESDLNDPRVISPQEKGGWGLHAQWSDDFHHVLHTLLTGERAGYYEDFHGVPMLAKVFREGYAFTGEYSVARKRRHGSSPKTNGYQQFVICSQNHDQIGNRMLGERLSQLAGLESLKLAASAVILSPFIPMFFMGEEYGERTPFLYFTSHSDVALINAVRTGRAREFAAFNWLGDVPDPHAETTFLKSKLDHRRVECDPESGLLRRFYRELIRFRKALPSIHAAVRSGVTVDFLENPPVLRIRYAGSAEETLLMLCFAQTGVSIRASFTTGKWKKLFDSAEPQWGGPDQLHPAELVSNGCIEMNLAPRSAALWRRAD